MISIAVVDDMDLVRNMFVESLQKLDNVEIWGNYENGKAFIDALDSSEELPDIAIVDIKMPEMNGVEVCSWVKNRNLPLKIIVLSQYDQSSYIYSAAQSGACGYLLKNVQFKEIQEAIKSVHENGYHFSEFFTPSLLMDLVHTENIKPTFHDIKPLTAREIEITKLICQELPYKEIASRLGIAVGTVDELKSRAMKKVGAKKVTGLVIYAAYKGWV